MNDNKDLAPIQEVDISNTLEGIALKYGTDSLEYEEALRKYALANLPVAQQIALRYGENSKQLADYIRKRYNRENVTYHRKEKIGRNDLCSCGSGVKYKYCCGK